STTARRRPRRRDLLLSTAAAVAAGPFLVGVAGCGDPGAVRLVAPSPTGAVASQCTALVRSAPQHVANQSRRDVTPKTPFAAAWGDPPIELRCGGAKPAALR